MCLTEPKLNDPKKSTCNFSPHGSITENNNKTIKQSKYDQVITLLFALSNVTSAVMYDCGQIVLCHKSVYFSIRKLILYFAYYFHVPYTILSSM